MTKIKIFRIAVYLSFVLLIGCTSTKVMEDLGLSDEELYERGMNHLENGDYDKALLDLDRVELKNPKSQYLADAKLAAADARFKKNRTGAYLRAIANYSEFIKLYPLHPKADWAYFQLGNSYLEISKKYYRDQTDTRKALKYYRECLEKFPDSVYRKDVEATLNECLEKLAAHELAVVKYYMKSNKYLAASLRLRDLLETYPDSLLKPEAYFDLGESLRKLGNYIEAEIYYRKLIEEFPENEKVKESRKLIEEMEKDAKT